MNVTLLHDGNEGAAIAEARLVAAGHTLVPAADGEVILLLLPTARAAQKALAGSPHERACCIVDFCDLQIDVLAGAIPLLEARWVEDDERREITVTGPVSAPDHVRRVLDAIAPSRHDPDRGWRCVRAADGPLYKRWLTEPIREDDVERKHAIGITLIDRGVTERWQEAMQREAAWLPFPQRPCADAAIAAALREGRAPFGYVFLEWKRLHWRMLDGDELWAFDSSQKTWAALMGRAGIALVRAGEVIAWLDTMMS